MTQTPDASPAPSLAAMIEAMIASHQREKALASQAKKTPKSGGASPSPAKTVERPKPQAGDWKLSLRWVDHSITLVVNEVHCINCDSVDTSSQPHLFLQRYHPQFGIHREAIALHDPKHAELPRRLSCLRQDISFCRHCFVSNTVSSAQLRLFGSTDGIMQTPGGNILLDLFDSPNSQSGIPALAPASSGPFEMIAPAGTRDRDRAAVPSQLPFYPPVLRHHTVQE